MMGTSDARRILGRLRDDEFVGRDAEMGRLLSFETTRGRGPRLTMLLGKTRVGKSELLRKSFDQLFNESAEVVPAYYSLKPNRLAAEGFARDFLSSFLAQLIAFRRADANLLALAREPILAIARSAAADDYVWVKAITDAFVQAAGAGDPAAMLQCALSAPSRAAQHTGLMPFVMFDDVHLLIERPARHSGSGLAAPIGVEHYPNELRYEFFDSLKECAADSSAPRYALSGFERPLTELMPPDQELFSALGLIRVEPVGQEVFKDFICVAAAERGVEITDSLAELMGHQLNSDFFYARAVLDGAILAGISLATFVDFERVYSEEVTTGRIGRYLGALIRDAAPDRDLQRAALEALSSIADTDEPKPLDSVIERMGLAQPDAEDLLERLHARELLNVGHRLVDSSSDSVLIDYARATYRSEVLSAPKPLAGSPLLAEKLKAAHRLMIGRYDRGFEARLSDVLARFALQSAPACLFDDAAFEKRYRGLSRAQVSWSLDEEPDRIALPQVVEVEDAGGGEHAGIGWRLFMATGFEAGIYNEASEALWIAALINSKEPLDVESLGRIDERIEAAVLSRRSKAARTIRWYIGKEGFSAAATQRIESAQAFRSTHAQLEALSDYLLRLSTSDAPTATEFELVIPIEDEAELIAARTAELIAQSADFEQEAINQIKTAVVEACINAAEHGQSPDRKIHQRFAIAEDRIIITVSNKGKIFGSTNGHTSPVAGSQAKGVRGRGLNIIRALMDEVHFQRTDDGTSLVMTKFLKRPENQ